MKNVVLTVTNVFWFYQSVLKTLVFATLSSIWQVTYLFCTCFSVVGCLNKTNPQCAIYWEFIDHFGVVLYLVVFSVLEAKCFIVNLEAALLQVLGKYME